VVQNISELLGGDAREISGIGRLSATELEVARLIAEGLRNREIARVLHRSEKTVERHVSQIFQKLGIDKRQTRFDRRVLTCRAVLAVDLSSAIVALAAIAHGPFT
jgi:DNA-binding NarL/FixJ family response regulator